MNLSGASTGSGSGSGSSGSGSSGSGSGSGAQEQSQQPQQSQRQAAPEQWQPKQSTRDGEQSASRGESRPVTIKKGDGEYKVKPGDTLSQDRRRQEASRAAGRRSSS